MLNYSCIILPFYHILVIGSKVWHFCLKSDSDKLEKLHERALRSVFQDKENDYQYLLNRANKTTLYNHRLQNISTAISIYVVGSKLQGYGTRPKAAATSSTWNPNISFIQMARHRRSSLYGRGIVNFADNYSLRSHIPLRSCLVGLRLRGMMFIKRVNEHFHWFARRWLANVTTSELQLYLYYQA